MTSKSEAYGGTTWEDTGRPVSTGPSRNSCNQNHGRIVGVYNDGSILYVAVIGAIGDWAAYSMSLNKFKPDTSSPEVIDYVRRHGNKMYDKHAFELFPWLNPKRWRP